MRLGTCERISRGYTGRRPTLWSFFSHLQLSLVLHLPGAVLALLLIAGGVQQYLSLIDRAAEFLRRAKRWESRAIFFGMNTAPLRHCACKK